MDVKHWADSFTSSFRVLVWAFTKLGQTSVIENKEKIVAGTYTWADLVPFSTEVSDLQAFLSSLPVEWL